MFGPFDDLVPENQGQAQAHGQPVAPPQTADHGAFADLVPGAQPSRAAHEAPPNPDYSQGRDVEYADDQAAVNPAQAATARELEARGMLDPNAAMGSKQLPFMLRPGRENPPDYWRIDMEGKLIPPDVDPRALADARAKMEKRADQPIGGVLDPGYWGGERLTPKAGDVGRTSTAMVHGMSYGFGDEINAGFDAAGNAIGHALGKDPGYGPKDAYRASLLAQDADAEDFARRHPVINTAAEITGAVAAPGSVKAMKLIAEAPTTLARAGRGVIAGTAMGALSGAGNAEGDLGDRATGAAIGGLEGGAIGGALPIAGKGLDWVYRGAKGVTKDALRAAVAKMTGNDVDPNIAASPKQIEAAMQTVSNLMRSKGMSIDDLRAAAVAAGEKPLTTAEAIGRPGVTKLAQLSRRAGTTPDAVEGAMDARAIEMPTRIQGDFEQATGLHPEAVRGDIEKLASDLRAKAGPLYDEAYAAGAIESPTLTAIAQRPSTRAALAKAYKIASEEGRNPEDLGLVRTTRRAPGGGTVDEVVAVKNPTTQTWDYVKRGLDDVLEKYRNPLTKALDLDTEGRAIVQTQNVLKNELFKLNPKYRDAVAAGGDPIRLEQAFKDGGDLLLNGNFPAKDYAARIAKLSDADRQAWNGGIANRLFNLAQAGRLKPGVLNSAGIRAKLESALGPDATSTFLGKLQQEAKMAKTGARMSPATGSQTYELGGAEADGTPVADLARLAVRMKTNPLAAIGELAGKGMAYGATAGEEPGVRNAAGDILLQHPDFTAKQLDEMLAKIKIPRRRIQGFAIPVGTNLLGDATAPKRQ